MHPLRTLFQRKPPARFQITAYKCPTCGHLYETQEAVEYCYNSTGEQEFSVGDVVVIERGYGWYDGDPAWVLDREGYEFHGEKTYRMYYVVTAVDLDLHPNSYQEVGPCKEKVRGHRLRYHVASRAWNGKDGYYIGWNVTGGTHFHMMRTTLKAANLPGAEALLGRKTSHLL